MEIYNQPANRFVASFVGGNNFLKAENQNGDVYLDCSGDKINELSGTTAEVIAAVRPENLMVHLDSDTLQDDQISIPGTIKQISFVGREMEAHGTTESGELLKAVSRPDVRILNLNHGDEIRFAFARSDISLFEDNETGQRLQ